MHYATWPQTYTHSKYCKSCTNYLEIKKGCRLHGSWYCRRDVLHCVKDDMTPACHLYSLELMHFKSVYCYKNKPSLFDGVCSGCRDTDAHVRDCVRSYTEDWAIVNRK